MRSPRNCFDRVARQGDAAQGLVCRSVVVDLQPQGLEQPPRQIVGYEGEIDGCHRQAAEQVGVRRPVDLIFQLHQLLLQALLLRQQLSAALVDVSKELLVGRLDQFQVADEALFLSLRILDRCPE
ncbi:hypothetical protein ACFFS2_30870 [Streptomyces aurantiacus]|uniref:hypothetical protein n=1 Tax=Streptomyces aurantiacus TaxID=47760 RepID=UPI0016841612|nr:hypothetical protein [Streptomyces aurantiacus]